MKKIIRKIHLQYFTVFIEKSPHKRGPAPFKPVVQGSTVHVDYILSVYIICLLCVIILTIGMSLSHGNYFGLEAPRKQQMQEGHSNLPFSF